MMINRPGEKKMDFFPNYTDSSGGELLNSFEGESSIGDLLDDFYDEDDDDFLDFAMEDDNNNFTDTIGNLSLFFKEIPTNDTLETVMFDFHSILGDFGGKDEQNADDVEPILVPSKSLTTFIVFYSLIAAIGIIGNSTLLMAIVCSPRMRSTARNTFIAVLGLSDLTQCFVTVPLKLWYLMSREWPFGDRYEWLCKVAHSSLMMPLFLSSLAIVAIAYDRFRCINQSHRSPLSPRASGALSLIMVIAAVLLSTPLFVTAHLGNVLVLPDGNFLNMGNVTVCENSWEGGSMKYYMIAVSTVQYAVPILIVLFVYVSIHRRLRNRPRGNPRNEKRRSRASTLMAAITFVFFISWLPYNIFHLMMVTTPGYFQSAFQGNEDKVYALLHFFGFSNAWINPLLYGYLNENIRREYKKIYRRMPWYSTTEPGAGAISVANRNSRAVDGRKSRENQEHRIVIETHEIFSDGDGAVEDRVDIVNDDISAVVEANMPSCTVDIRSYVALVHTRNDDNNGRVSKEEKEIRAILETAV